MRLIARVRGVASRCVMPLALRAAKAYVAGEHLHDALAAADKLAERGLGFTIGYSDSPDDSPRRVADAYLAGIWALAGREHSYLSIKAPSLDYSRDLMAELVEQAEKHRVRLHFDALAPESADRSRELFEHFHDAGADLSYTLPGRWARSVSDAIWAVERGIVVRVVKGQWPDPADPGRDPRRGFVNVVDALAGRARHVAVASHDVPLVSEAVNRLRNAKTSCGMELLYGLPMKKLLQQANWLALGVHVYVPYGKSHLPYALSKMRENPRMMWWLVRDLFAAHASSSSPRPQRHEVAAP